MPEELWSAVEEGLTPSVAVTLHTWLDAPNKSVAQAKDFNICVAGGKQFFIYGLNPLASERRWCMYS